MRCGRLWLPSDLLPEDISSEREECGVFIGTRFNSGSNLRMAHSLIRLDNIHEEPESHYHMQVPPMYAKRTVATWHTHITGNPLPSMTDMRESKRLGLPGVIVTTGWLVCVFDGFQVWGPQEY